VPHHGISVGVATITASKEASMIVFGSGKSQTLSRILAADSYEADWPATLIHECPSPEIVCDRDAHANGARPV
jgi:glucosamine-6-phosphate deaminase